MMNGFQIEITLTSIPTDVTLLRAQYTVISKHCSSDSSRLHFTKRYRFNNVGGGQGNAFSRNVKFKACDRVELQGRAGSFVAAIVARGDITVYFNTDSNLSVLD